MPYGRGKPRSMNFEDLISQARNLFANGYKEIVLTGINLGLYKDKNAGKDLSDVVKALNDIAECNILRLSSIEPDLWSTRLIRSIKESNKVCSHFHIPIQSGADNVLIKMKRRYGSDHVLELVYDLLSIRPSATIGFDIICNFPGETNEDFRKTIDPLDKLPIAYLHVFNYSSRKNTPAAIMKDQVTGKTRKERMSVLLELNKIKKNEYLAKLIESKEYLQGISEKINKAMSTALSDHYIRIYKKIS